MVEDLHDLLHEMNGLMFGRGYDRMEELLDPAGFSGFISRSTVDRIERQSRALVRNAYHNGYPDLLPRGVYPSDSVQHGTLGGLEVKASRGNASWQSHGPRAGWFLVVQFDIDQDETKALHDREPTHVRAVLVAELEEDDWSWQPAAQGRIRSGTASIKPSGAVKLRDGAVWVDPDYQDEHDERLLTARREVFRETCQQEVLTALRAQGGAMRPDEVAAAVAPHAGVPADRLKSTVTTALRKLVQSGQVKQPARGRYEA